MAPAERVLRRVAAAIGSTASPSRWPPLGGQQRVVAGERVAGDFGQVALSNRTLTVPAATVRMVGARSVQAATRQVLTCAPRLPVAGARSAPELVHLTCSGPMSSLRLAGTTRGRAQQAEDDLQRTFLAVAAVAAPGHGQRAFQIAGREVVEHQRVVLKVPWPAASAWRSTSNRRVEFVLVDPAEAEPAQLGGEGAGGRELRLRVDDAGDSDEKEAAAAGCRARRRCGHAAGFGRSRKRDERLAGTTDQVDDAVAGARCFRGFRA